MPSRERETGELAGAPVAVKVNDVRLVMLSVLEAPESLAVARLTAPGADKTGGVGKFSIPVKLIGSREKKSIVPAPVPLGVNVPSVEVPALTVRVSPGAVV